MCSPDQPVSQHIVCACDSHLYSSPSGKAASEDLPMEDNPAYRVVKSGVVDIYITLSKDQKKLINVGKD